MKEYSFSAFKDLTNGLRPDDRAKRNSGFLTQCKNVRTLSYASVKDVAVFVPISDPFATNYLTGLGISVSHPFPQALKGRSVTLLADDTALYTVTESTNWTLSQITTKDAYDAATNKSISSGGAWHFADLGDSYALFNGSCLVFKMNREGMFGGTDQVMVMDSVSVQTGCAFRGRLMMGGFNSSDFFNAHWKNFLKDGIPDNLGIAYPVAPGTNFVWWSQIGSDAFWLLYPESGLQGLIRDDDEPYTDDNPMFWDMIERNEMGFMPMPWQGTIRCMLPLGKGVMVYGDNGVSFMPMAGGTFGLNEVMSIGVAGRGAVCNNGVEHLYVDKAGWLWRVRDGEQPENLGFREFFEDMTGSDIVISYDPIEREYHISDGLECFTLNSAGALYENTYLSTSMVVSNGGTVGVYGRPAVQTEMAYADICTDVFDMEIRGIKTIERVILGVTNTTGVTVAIDWRYKTSDAWSRTGFKAINFEGSVPFPVKGLEFRLAIRCLDYTKMDIDDVDVHFKTDDKRIVRGTYALKNVARAS